MDIEGNNLVRINDDDLSPDGSFTSPDNIQSIGKFVFSKNTKLSNIVLKQGLKSIEMGALEHTKIKSITLPPGLISIGAGACQVCADLEKVTLQEGLNSIGDGAFQHCTSLKSITLPKGLASIGRDAFKNCTSLTSVILPQELVSIGDHAFDDCDNIKFIAINTDDKDEFERIKKLLPQRLQSKALNATEYRKIENAQREILANLLKELITENDQVKQPKTSSSFFNLLPRDVMSMVTQFSADESNPALFDAQKKIMACDIPITDGCVDLVQYKENLRSAYDSIRNNQDLSQHAKKAGSSKP